MRESDEVRRDEAEEVYRRVSASASRRRKRRRLAAVVGGLMSITFVAIVLTWALRELSPLGSRSIEPASSDNAQDEANYIISDVRISDPPGGPAGSVLVSYRIGWRDVFPGPHECELTVFDAAGEVIGRGSVDEHLLPQRNEGGVWVRIDGEPVRAEVRCDPERLDTPVAYDIYQEKVIGVSPNGVEISYRVDWPTGFLEHPGTNGCTATVRAPGGDVIADQRFTLQVPEGTRTSVIERDAFSEWPGADADPGTLSANVECHPYGPQDAQSSGD